MKGCTVLCAQSAIPSFGPCVIRRKCVCFRRLPTSNTVDKMSRCSHRGDASHTPFLMHYVYTNKSFHLKLRHTHIFKHFRWNNIYHISLQFRDVSGGQSLCKKHVKPVWRVFKLLTTEIMCSLRICVFPTLKLVNKKLPHELKNKSKTVYFVKQMCLKKLILAFTIIPCFPPLYSGYKFPAHFIRNAFLVIS